MARSTLAYLLLAFAAGAQDRLPPIPHERYTEAQKKAAAEFLAARKVPVFGPFEPLMRSPELMSAARAMGDYLRYKPAIGTVLSELAILVTARAWSQDYEWYVHAPLAVKAGLRPELVEAVRDGRRPAGMSDDEALVHDFCVELQRTHRVSDVTYAAALKHFGEQGVVDLAGIAGYYTFLAMTLNTSRYPLPDGGVPLPRFP